MNPCKCGYLSDAELACTKAPKCASDYQSKLSGPLLDRIDINIEVPPVTPFDLNNENINSISSEKVKERVERARYIQQERYKEFNININSEAEGDILLETCNLTKQANLVLKESYTKMNLSMRGYNRVIRVARTIADLESSKDIDKLHVYEALNYRKRNFA